MKSPNVLSPLRRWLVGALPLALLLLRVHTPRVAAGGGVGCSVEAAMAVLREARVWLRVRDATARWAEVGLGLGLAVSRPALA